MTAPLSQWLGKLNLKLFSALIIVFLLLTMPVIATMIGINYRANETLIANYSERFMYRSINDNINNTTKLFAPIVAIARTSAELMRDEPEYFRKVSSADYLQKIVASNEAVYAAYASFEDGSLREVRRAVKDSKVYQHTTPAGAQFISRYINARPPGLLSANNAAENTRGRGFEAMDSFAFHGEWKQLIEEFATPAQYDPRLQEAYKNTQSLKLEQISNPFVFPSAGEVGITVSAPVFSREGGRTVGVVGVDLTLRTLSKALAENKVTQNSITLIVDESGGVVAHTDDAAHPEQGAATPYRRVSQLNDPRVVTAWAERLRTKNDRFVFRAGPDNAEYQCVFFPFPEDFNKPWELMMITPTEDFVGDLNRNNRQILLIGLVAFLIQIGLIYLLSRSLSKPLENLLGQIDKIRRLEFGTPGTATASPVREIRYLFDAILLMERALESFASYVPRGLVRQLVDSDWGTKHQVSSRYLTMFFTDLEGFSSLSETEPQQQLLTRVSDYFSNVTGAIEQEKGTVDKFIGDAVMAFWGAPQPMEDHAYHACVAAVRAQRRMRGLNHAWAERKLPPLKVRIGIHSDAVLVGNVGSKDRLSYTVMGDGVNIASRLEGINKDMGTWTCVSHHVFRETGERLCLRPIDTVTVKGRKGELLIFDLIAILDGDPEVTPSPDDLALCDLTTTAYGHYAQGAFLPAIDAYQAVLARFPGDRVAQRMLEKSQARLSGPCSPSGD